MKALKLPVQILFSTGFLAMAMAAQGCSDVAFSSAGGSTPAKTSTTGTTTPPDNGGTGTTTPPDNGGGTGTGGGTTGGGAGGGGTSGGGGNTGGGTTTGGGSTTGGGGTTGGGTTTGGGSTTGGGGTTGGGDDCGCTYDWNNKTGPLTAAFEDLYPDTPVAHIDNDYNDFVVGFSIDEINKNSQLQKIEMTFKPIAHKAAYDHTFSINLKGDPQHDANDDVETKAAFKGDAMATLTTYDSKGNVLSVADVDPSTNITIFSSTADLFASGNKVDHAKLIVYIKNCEDNYARNKVDLKRYRIYIKVKNTGHFLEPASNNIDLISADGHPDAFIIKGDYKIPVETHNIEETYPKFKLYRAYLLKKKADPTYKGTNDEVNWYE